MYRMLLITRCPSFCVFSLHGITAIIIIATIFNIEGNKYNLISILKHLDTWLLSEMVCQWPGYGNSERLANNISILMHLGNDFVLLWINWNYKLE